MPASVRLRLRALTASDLAFFRDLYGDAETMRHIGRPLPRAQASAMLLATLDAARQPLGPQFFVIVEHRHRCAVGLCSIRGIPTRTRDVEAGIMLARSARGLGYAREAFGALIAAAFRTLSIDAVWVQHRPANAAMARLCDALGFAEARGWPAHGAKSAQCVRILPRPARRTKSNQPDRGNSMSNIIGFLENAGRDAALRHASREQLLHSMREQEISPALQTALLQPQRSALDALLGVREKMYAQNVFIKSPKKKAPAKKKPAKAPPKKTPAKKPAKKTPAKPKR